MSSDLADRRKRRAFAVRGSIIATRGALAATTAGGWGLIGVLGVLTALLTPGDEPAGPVWLLSALSLAVGAVFALVGTRLSTGAYYGTALASVLLLGGQMWLQRGHPEGAASAHLLPLLSMYVFAFFAAPPALLAEALVLGVAVTVGIGRHGLPATEIAALIVLNVAVAGVVHWLVRAAADADTDPVTGLPRGRALDRHLTAALGNARPRQPLTVALLEPDRPTGPRDQEHEQAFRALMSRWNADLPGGALLARHTDRGIALVLASSPAETNAYVDRWRAETPEAPFSAGIAAARRDDVPALLLGRAHTALYEAQRDGGDRTYFSQDDYASNWSEMATALAAGEFSVAYQPIVDARTRRVVGAEALLRWNRPDGPVSPTEFIPLAERSGFIAELDRWVLHTACVAAATWPADVPAKITVNVTGRDLHTPGYHQHVLDILRDAGLPPTRLVLEITESTLEADTPEALDVLHQLRAHGVRIAIDDFGTGYSSLGRLQHLPADILKVDRSFVTPLEPGQTDAPVVTAITALARAFGLRTVAEGIEHEHQATLLTTAGCDELQGWLHGRPGPAEHIRNALTAQRDPGELADAR
ncbi:putative bifunctional diguanylate cyclase/phosphodiesterase [Cryptosporangium sp. NPDC051539]|uniref:putative bifunctional diguanylate cyclase/phosphodiesterase n=1 Tax=Cryptosporangium sp. NPDC051539 TaxID=3363962 RepID=UPI00379D2150